MKKLNTKSLLGIVVAAAGLASSYGQGTVWLDNYSAAGSPRINWGAGVMGQTEGQGVGDPSYRAVLYFVLGTGPADPAGNDDISGFGGASPGTVFLSGAGAGYLNAVIDSIPTYLSGPITFQVAAYNGADYASSLIRGHSASFTLNSITTGTQVPVSYLDGLASFSVSPVPEPSTCALVGLGVASLLFFRRRQ